MDAVETSAADDQVELACLEVRGQSFGIEVQQIREIVRAQELTRLPRAPRLLEGVIDLRGTIVPVVDLGRALGGDPVAAGPRARIAILEVDGLVFGLRAGAASDVLAVPAADVHAPPGLMAQTGYDAVRAVVRRAGQAPVLVLSLEHVLESVYRSGIPGTARDPSHGE
jgi:purine-binding chemotaxis protein CheW